VATHHDIFNNRHISEEFYILKSPGNPLFGNEVGLQPVNGFVSKKYLPPRWGMESRDDVVQGGLTRAVGPDQRFDLSWLDAEGDILQGRETAEGFSDVRYLEEVPHSTIPIGFSVCTSQKPVLGLIVFFPVLNKI
jgi:hypothetical protein